MTNVELESRTRNSPVVSTVTTPALLDRFESKYAIPIHLVDQIIQFIQPYCSHDKYSALSPDRYYIINSLYFDTPDFLFLRKRILKAERRFNMRIRCYGDNPTFPYFFEIKQRIGDIVRKTRARIDDPEYARYFFATNDQPPPLEDPKNCKHRDLFYHTAFKYNAQPVVLVQYRRQAFFSNYEEYARVTFDINLRFKPQNDYNPLPVEEAMIPCDLPLGNDNCSHAILELKCYTSFVPLWMIDLVRTFNLQKTGFSKFTTCLKGVFSRYSQDGLFNRSKSFMFEDFFPEEL
jgi:SPX domain protein involved in polyphosphate accumulation